MRDSQRMDAFYLQKRVLFALVLLVGPLAFSQISFTYRPYARASKFGWMIAASFSSVLPESFLNLFQIPNGSANAKKSLVETPSGFYYPLGRSSTGGYLGWMKTNPHFKNLDGTPKYHLGVDFKGQAGDAVYAVSDGEVVGRRTNLPGYGGDHLKGGALLIRHRTADGTVFFALYGCLENMTQEKRVAAGDEIGTLSHYYSRSNDGETVNLPHLHFGIYPGELLPVFSSRWLTYSPSSSNSFGWTNPVEFMLKHHAPARSSHRIEEPSTSPKLNLR